MKTHKISVLLVLLLFFSCSENETSLEITISIEDFETTINENPELGQSLGIVNASTNIGDLIYTIPEQSPTNAIEINSATGELKILTASVFDFETNPTITGIVKVENSGVSDTANITINLNDVNEITPITTENFKEAINNCLSTNPIDGMCTDSEYGAMPDWDVSGVTDMSEAFLNRTDFNADISSWDVSNVTTMYNMFAETSFNQNIGNWNVGNVTRMTSMFANTPFNQDIGEWDISNNKRLDTMFEGATSFNQDIGNWDVSNVEGFNGMFEGATSFNQDIGNWQLRSVGVDIQSGIMRMFEGATSFNQDISNWDISNIDSLSRVFFNATSFNQDLSSWDISNISSINNMFDNSGLSFENYDAILSGWSSQELKQSLSFGAEGINYCNGEAARQSIIDKFGWTITDAGLNCN